MLKKQVKVSSRRCQAELSFFTVLVTKISLRESLDSIAYQEGSKISVISNRL